MNIPQELRELIESGALAHFVTLNPDGGPQVTAIWVGLDGDDVIAAHLPYEKKLKNIHWDPPSGDLVASRIRRMLWD